MGLKKLIDYDKAAERLKDDSFLQLAKQNPERALESITDPFHSDVWLYRLVVGVLGLSTLLVITLGGLIFYSQGKDLPQGLVALGSMTAGALAGLLAPSPAGR